jgi:predicted DNA-binding transcriptional regulator AlpA
VKEIAGRYEVEYNSAWRWTKRADFPAPTARPGGRPIWRAADVEKWAKTHLPLRPGPRRAAR